MKIIKNFKKKELFKDEFYYIKIKQDEDVFAELPICLADYDRDYINPVLYVGIDAQIPLVMEEQELLKKIEGTKLFYFKTGEEGKVIEVDGKEAEFAYRLPINTPVDKLAIIQGQLGILDDVEVDEKEVK